MVGTEPRVVLPSVMIIFEVGSIGSFSRCDGRSSKKVGGTVG